MNILFVTQAPPDLPHDGARLIVHHLAKQLASTGQHTLRLASLLPQDENAQAARERLRAWFTQVELVPLPSESRARRWTASMGSDAPLWVHAYHVPALRGVIQRIAEQTQVDVVHCDTGMMAQYAGAIRGPKIVAPHDTLARALELQAHDALHPLVRMAARFQIGRMRRYEARAYAQFARVVMVTPEEEAALKAFAPQLATCVIPNGVDTSDFVPAVKPAPDDTIGFVGAMDYAPNQAAVLYFAREILPLIRQVAPDLVWTIIGRNPPRAIQALADDSRIHVTGTVEDVRSYVNAQRVIVCPVLRPGGIKNKVLEALACGKAVVATPEAVNGLDVRDGVELIIARERAAFAGACLRLLQDSAARERLERAARAWAREHGWERTAQAYVGVYHAAIGGNG